MSSVPENMLTNEDRRITAALGEAIRDALRVHKREGNPVAVWRDGRVVEIPPEDIVIPHALSEGSNQGQSE